MLFRVINDNRNGAIIISILLVCSAVPTTTIVAYLAHDIEFCILNVLYWLFIITFYSFKGRKIVIGNWEIRRSETLIYAVFIFFAIVILVVGVLYTGFHISFNLYDVYGTRDAYKDSSIPTVFKYLFAAGIIVFPIMIVYGLNQKRYVLVIGAVVFQVLAFFVDGRKSAIFALVATILGYYFIHNLTSKMIPFIMMCTTLVGFLEKFIIGTENFINLVVRRLFLVTAYLQYSYFDYFNGAEKDYFRQGLIGRLGFDSPYSQDIPKLIGSQYYVNESYANNGLFADAYSNCGAIGVVILPLLIVLSLKILDSASKDLTSGTCMGIIIIASYTFLSSSFFTVMLTHGFLLGCLIIYLFPRFKYQRQEVKRDGS